MSAISRKVEKLEKPVETEPFPRLGQSGTTSHDTGKDLWAGFSKDKGSQSTNETQRTSPRKEDNGMRRPVPKP